MAEWKKELRKLTKDFGLTPIIYKVVVDATVKQCKGKEKPPYYKTMEDYMYDIAQRKLRTYIMRKLEA